MQSAVWALYEEFSGYNQLNGRAEEDHIDRVVESLIEEARQRRHFDTTDARAFRRVVGLLQTTWSN